MFGFSKDISLSNPFSRSSRSRGESGSRGDSAVAAAADKKGKYDKKDAPLAITDIVMTCLDVAFGTANGGQSVGYAALGQHVAQGAQNSYKAKGNAKIEVPPSPHFVAHGHSKGDITTESPATLKYLQRRRIKEVGGNGFGVAGSVAVAASMGHLPVNALSIAKQANTTVSTAAHLTQLKILAREIDALEADMTSGVSLSELVREVIKVKAHKSGIEGTKLVTGSIPVLGEIVTSAVTGAVNGATAAAKTFDKAFHAKNCARLALEIHWIAYQEQFRAWCRMHRLDPDEFLERDNYLARRKPPRLAGKNLRQANEALREHDRPPRLKGKGLSAAREALEAHNPPASRLPSAELDRVVHEARQSFYFHRDAGPATKLVAELFTRRSALAVLGRYDVAALIMEPGGWVALTDKISSL
ncbi:hypothetical protein SAMN03159496_01239 [Rhizobium sp. NFR07]|uniref:hypothetical protein n=1 Tax=Rhizobium sp. NFR07 TaxID=1566262 RepID=UPI0008E1337C|nr:hypothetical protein [Rhizobium sp. NFR07]SFA96863.1 hypothetical protein SAMN03159496_01239 [Rhizobium sp. NFR07]